MIERDRLPPDSIDRVRIARMRLEKQLEVVSLFGIVRAPAHREHRFQRIVNTHSTIVNTPASASSAMSGKGGDAA
jgi:hypothetical protein